MYGLSVLLLLGGRALAIDDEGRGVRTGSTLFPLLRSELLARTLGLLFVGGGEYRLTDLASKFNVTKAAMTRPLQQLLESGAIRVRVEGRTKFVSADTDSPVYEPLRQLCLITYGPPVVIGEELGSVRGVAAAYIFGSWAARDAGIGGASPKDIDVLVVSDRASFSDVSRACARASQLLGREVNPVIKSISQWKQPDAFVRSILDGHITRLDLGSPQEGGWGGTDSPQEPGPSPGADPDWTTDFGLE